MNDGLKGVTGPRSRPIPARERAEHDDREGNQHPALIGLDESLAAAVGEQQHGGQWPEDGRR